MNELTKKIQTLSIVSNLHKVPLIYFDEPKYYFYSALTSIKSYYHGRGDYITPSKPFPVSGVSFYSEQAAKMKAFNEAIERFCLFCFDRNKITLGTFKSIKKRKKLVLDPLDYFGNEVAAGYRFGWVDGYKLTLKKTVDCYIPAQLAYLNSNKVYSNSKGKKEKLISISISTGAAAGYDHISTLLRGLYEVVERDATMCVYLNKIKLPTLNLNTIKSQKVQQVIQKITRYKLEIFLFDMTNDLKIPAFLTVLVDKTGLGPAITVGSKAGFDYYSAIIASMEEALMPRNWLRDAIIKNKGTDFAINKNKIKDYFDISKLWASKKNIKQLDFLLNNPSIPFKYANKIIEGKIALQEALHRIEQAGYSIYYTDITLPELKETGHFIYKVIVPKLQPLYINQERANLKKAINTERLRKVALHFEINNTSINTFPHPFP